MHATLLDLLSRAGQLLFRPDSLIRDIHATILQLRNFTFDPENETQLKTLHDKTHQLIQAFEKRRAEMKTYHSLRLRLPTDRPFTELKNEQTALVNPDSHELHNAEDEVRAHEERICNRSQCQPISDLAQIIRLVHTSMISRLWIRTLFFLDGQQIDSLKGSLMFLNDHLPIQCNWESNDKLVTNVLVSYAAHRFQLLQDEGQNNAMLSNYHVLTEVSEKVKKLAATKPFELVQRSREHQRLARESCACSRTVTSRCSCLRSFQVLISLG